MPHPLIVSFLDQLALAKRAPREQLRVIAQAVTQIPWGEGRKMEEVLHTKHVGTCTGKHLVLQACLDAISIPWRPVVCTFRWGEQGLLFPPHLTAILGEGEWDHGHNFVQVRGEDGAWMDLDVTWDPPLTLQGFRSLPYDWDGRTPFIGLTRLRERWNDTDMLVKKEELIAALSPAQRERRERFLAAFIHWIDSLRS